LGPEDLVDEKEKPSPERLCQRKFYFKTAIHLLLTVNGLQSRGGAGWGGGCCGEGDRIEIAGGRRCGPLG